MDILMTLSLRIDRVVRVQRVGFLAAPDCAPGWDAGASRRGEPRPRRPGTLTLGAGERRRASGDMQYTSRSSETSGV
jgi:hypothetical protein